MAITYEEYLAIHARAAERGEYVGCIEAEVVGMPVDGLDRLMAWIFPSMYAPSAKAARELELEL